MNSLLLLEPLHRQILNAVRHCSNGRETYYDILQVRNDCSNQEIRSAFVELSKKFHPDVKGVSPDPKETAKFVKISEAYQTLSKPSLRDAYDQDLLARGFTGPNAKTTGTGLHTTEIHRPWEVHPNYDPNPGPYYGVKGLQKISNSKIAWALLALGLFGAVFGFASVKHSFTFNRKLLDEKSAEAGNHHAAVRAEAQKFGNEEQLRRMVTRMMKEER